MSKVTRFTELETIDSNTEEKFQIDFDYEPPRLRNSIPPPVSNEEISRALAPTAPEPVPVVTPPASSKKLSKAPKGKLIKKSRTAKAS